MVLFVTTKGGIGRRKRKEENNISEHQTGMPFAYM